jgi:signal transduction histidine kinase
MTTTVEFLKKIPLFAGLTGEECAAVAEMVEEVRLKADEILFEEGASGQHAYVIMEGELEIIKEASDRQVLIAVRGPGEVIGEIALIEEAPRMATARARSDLVLLAIDKQELDRLLEQSRSVLNALFRNVLGRLRDTEDMLRQSEKMAQLGTLTAGVAHELNNPAAAISREQAQLLELLPALFADQGALFALGLSVEQKINLDDLHRLAVEKSRQPIELDALARSDRLDEIEGWAATKGILDGIQAVTTYLVDLDLQTSQLDEIAAAFPEKEALTLVLKIIAASYGTYSLLMEMGQGAKRISEIVGTLKSYAYLDQAPVQEIDVHDGIEDTLLIFGSRLKEGVSVKRQYGENLPRIQAYGNELNQVWTNLIDNAIDAMEGKGEIVIRSRAEGDWVVVEFEDNGPGIPQELQGRIFDPFFTTKPIGKGTGLGLNITYNIIANKHRGDIRLKSEPGKTVFEVWLPVNFQGEEAPE